ncbi:hypothetical protein D9619_011072 [Psilocybe cf. subviscida]|uniref:Uncharacterized protein n=1 Tax=Psilocybe cf. subviscida TaxID=2480587 RepID=A0A8H5B8E8_9AGAR|nr:hypothetical protein D9619_011072 [Psilocybe cf. subviscida]
MASTGGLSRRRVAGGGGGGSSSPGFNDDEEDTGTRRAANASNSSSQSQSNGHAPARTHTPLGTGGAQHAGSAFEGGSKIAFDPRDLEMDGVEEARIGGRMPKLTIMEEVLLLGIKDKQP